MAIGNAIEKGSWVDVYNEKNQRIFQQAINPNNGDRLMGYTSSTVNIKQGYWINTYDEKGRRIGQNSAR